MQEVDISDPAAWDDTELIGAYERAVNSYLVRDCATRSHRARLNHPPPPRMYCRRRMGTALRAMAK